jgi:hypothetical protein
MTQLQPHSFVGPFNRWCEVCNLPDRNPIHKTDTQRQMSNEKLTGEQIAAAWREWIESEEGRRCMDRVILKTPEHDEYLHNRLWCAYMAGFAAATAALEAEK